VNINLCPFVQFLDPDVFFLKIEPIELTFKVSGSIVLQLSEGLSEFFFGHFLLFPLIFHPVLVPEHFQRNTDL